ncbi:MAG TPA: hypothetical protein VIB08_08100 [Thermoanaerobaculia bacterium]
MAETDRTQKLLELRKITRHVAELLRADLKQALGTLMPMLQPRTLLGHYVQGASKDPARGGDRVFKEVLVAWEAVAGTPPFSLPRDLKPPLPVDSHALEFAPFEYAHAARGRKTSKTIAVTSPLRWVLSYSGYAPQRLQEALASGDAGGGTIQEHVLHHVVLHVAMSQKGVAALFDALHFPVSTEQLAGLGSLPVTVVSSSIATVRPPDETLIESTEVSGTDAFEEVVDVQAIRDMKDPFREKLLAAVAAAGEG